MSDIAIIAASAKTSLLELANQSSALGTGLLHAAPGEIHGKDGKDGKEPNHTVRYLLEIAEALLKLAEECNPLLDSDVEAGPNRPGL